MYRSELFDHTHSWQDELEPGACSVAAGVPTCSDIYSELHFPEDLHHKHQNPGPEKARGVTSNPAAVTHSINYPDD